MKKNITNQLHKIVSLCVTKGMDVSILDDGIEIEIKIYENEPKYLMINIPNPEDKTLPKLLSECMKKIKAIP